MAEFNQKRIVVDLELNKVFQTINYKLSKEWELLFENITDDQAELVYLCGMLSGAGILALMSHGARKSIVFIKLFKKEQGKTEIVTITGGSESMFGLDFSRYEKIINHVLSLFEGVGRGEIEDVQFRSLTSDEAFDNAVEQQQKGNFEGALALYNQVIQLEPERGDSWYLKGTTLLSLGKQKEALDCFGRVLELNPHDEDAIGEIKKLKDLR